MKQYKPYFTYSEEIIKLIEEISRMQGELQGVKRTIENELSVHTLANLDAVHYSTKIEGNRLTIKQVTDVLSGKFDKKNIKNERDLKEILNYSKARAFLKEKADNSTRLSLQLILDTHSILMNDIVVGKLKGYLREDQNAIKDSGTNSIIYIPPDFREVKELMDSLILFMNKALLNNVNSLIVSAIFHYRFVTIHPFMDGNGRLARLITNYILLVNNYDIANYASIEKHHEKNRNEYYRRLWQLQGNNFYDIPENIDITSWIIYWLNCLKDTYIEALSRIGNIEVENIDTIILNNRAQKSLALFKKHIKMKASEYQILSGLGRTQAVSDLNQLVEKGFIKKVGKGKSTYYTISEPKEQIFK